MEYRSINAVKNAANSSRNYKRIAPLLCSCAIAFAIFASSTAKADGPIPTSTWTDFYGTLVEFNGAAAPLGSRVEAFDPSGVLCGRFDVTTAGQYGFMPTYGDDSRTAGLDEGAIPGEEITFTVNGRSGAMSTGSNPIMAVFPANPQLVNVSVTGTLGFESLGLPADKNAAPGDVIQFDIVFRNSGDVTDFYKLEVSSNLGWDLDFPTEFIYIPTGLTSSTVSFSVTVPNEIVGELSDQLSFSLTSGLDAANGVSGDVNLFVLITDVDDDNNAALPSSFTVGQNYPNPFNPTTKIPFSLRVSSEVTLSVYNVLGQKVDQLNYGTLSSGDHVIDYEPTVKSSGVYFYKIVAGEFSSTKRMILLK